MYPDLNLLRAKSVDAFNLGIQSSPAVAMMAAGLAFLLYGTTAAPGFTWANFGADGGDLLAAAATNGVPHPPGYPLYILLLQAWLALWGRLWPESNIAWRGNLFSAFWAATSVGITTHLIYRLAKGPAGRRWLVAGIAGLAWGVSPLLWSQAIITEVYALHAALFSLLAWILFAYRPGKVQRKALLLGLVTGLGLAHHLTFTLLLPAVLYWLWTESERPLRRPHFWIFFLVGVLPGLLLYVRIPIVASLTPPVNWGYAKTGSGLWWLVSGAAYRHYLLGMEPSLLLPRLSKWAQVLSTQYTPVGFGLAVAGLYRLDQRRPRLRNFCLLWLLPVSLYTLSYNTVDSEIYLLPVVWLLALWLPGGATTAAGWLRRWFQSVADLDRRLLVGTWLALLVLTGIRLPSYSLQSDREATDFLAALTLAVEPGSLIFSSADAETFTLWYGAYATGELVNAAPGVALVNVALYQFDWYRDLLADLYPDLAGAGSDSTNQILHANAGKRPIYFTEVIAPATQDRLEAAGPIWRYVPAIESP